MLGEFGLTDRAVSVSTHDSRLDAAADRIVRMATLRPVRSQSAVLQPA